MAASVSASSPPLPLIFTPFPRLPIELRLKIWRLSITPRIVQISWSRPKRQCLSPDIPTLLQVSREARSEGQKIYKRVFNTSNSAAPVYVAFDLDTVFFRWKTFGRRPKKHIVALREDFQWVRFLVIENWVRFNQGMEVIRFESLNELHITGCTEEVPDVIEDVELLGSTFAPFIKSILSSKKAHTVPRLMCLTQGARCRDHWWFAAWNERCTRRIKGSEDRGLECWQMMFTVINDLARGYLQERESHGQSIVRQSIK
ncbi:hypothetical protein VTL71DRAFT_15431 [Oculimacula yallundae]|uniref:2EXR domain-containing protein n=1 Tax=Oculimacula yallundae TaxID=86028 RepID=A0ABR4CGK4_9HELO